MKGKFSPFWLDLNNFAIINRKIIDYYIFARYDVEEMSKTDGRSSPQTGKWKSKEFRAFQGRKSHSAVDPAPEKGIEQVDQAERRSCLAER